MSDWALVGGQPARGDSEGVHRLAASVDSTADAAFDAKVSLGRVGAGMSSSLWEGAAATKFVSAFSPLGQDLGRMAESYGRAATALRTYATELAQIRGEAERALTRARLAKATADREGPALEGARGRIRSLTRQMGEVASDVRVKTRTLSTCTDPAQRDLLYDSIWRSRQYHGRLSRQYSDARAQEGHHQRALDEANESLRRQRDLIDALRHDHRRAEERAAQRIRDALDHSLRNKSDFEKVTGYVTDVARTVTDLERLKRWRDEQAHVQIFRFLETLEKWNDWALVASIALIAFGAVLTIATGGAALPLAAGLIALGMKGAVISHKASKVIGPLKASYTLYLAANDVRDPKTGRPVATWSDAAADVTKVGVAMTLGRVAKPLEKRFLFPDARHATGAWRSVKTLHAGKALSTSGQVVYGTLYLGVEKTVDLVGVAAGEAVRSRRVEELAQTVRRGLATPIIAPCYAPTFVR